MEKIKRILILRMEHIGDYVSSLPALKALREKFPSAKIDVVVGPWNKKLVESTPYVDEVIIFDNPLVKRDITYKEFISFLILKFKTFYKFFKKVRKNKYDLLITFSERKFNKIFTKLIRAKKKVGIGGLDLEGLHEVFRCFAPLKELGIKRPLGQAKLNYSDKDKKRVSKILNEIGGKKKILIHIMSPATYKCWPMEELSAFLVKATKKHKDYSFILLGAPSDEKSLNKIIKKIGDKRKIFNLAGEISLNQLPLLMKGCNLFLGIDSGPLQFAIFSKIPIIALYGGERADSTSKRWGPFARGDKIIKGRDIKDIKGGELVKFI